MVYFEAKIDVRSYSLFETFNKEINILTSQIDLLIIAMEINISKAVVRVISWGILLDRII